MASSKHLALFQTTGPATTEASEQLVHTLARRWQEERPDGLALDGLVLGQVDEPISPGPPVALTAQWWSDDSTEPLLAFLTAGMPDLRPSVWTVHEHVYRRPAERLSPGPAPDRINLFGTARRRDDFTHEAFFDYWDQVHAPISSAVPGLGGYVASEVREVLAGELPADGFIELWWPDRATFTASGDSPQQIAAWADVANYARTDGSFWLTHEHVLVPPPDTGPGSHDAGRA